MLDWGIGLGASNRKGCTAAGEPCIIIQIILFLYIYQIHFAYCILKGNFCGRYIKCKYSLSPGDQFHQRGVQGEHADHHHLSQGGIFLQGRRSAGRLFRCNIAFINYEN